MKGFSSRKVAHFTFDDFINCMSGELKLQIQNEPKFASLKQALRQGLLVTMTKEQSKEIRSVYSKRLIIQAGKGEPLDTKPIHLKMGDSNG